MPMRCNLPYLYLSSGIDMRSILKLLRLKNVETTMVYTHVVAK